MLGAPLQAFDLSLPQAMYSALQTGLPLSSVNSLGGPRD